MHNLHFQDENQLSLALIEAQYRLLKEQNKSLLIIVSGIETAGKGQAVQQLRELIDPRYLRVKSLAPQLLQPQQPIWLRYTPDLPAIGQITVMFGAWYSDLFTTALHATRPFNQHDFEHYVANIAQFEHDLQQNNVHVIKVWFDLSWKNVQKRLAKLDSTQRLLHALYGMDWQNKNQYDALQKLGQSLASDWFIINGEHPQRNQIFAEHILNALQQPIVKNHHTIYQAQKIAKTLVEPNTNSLNHDDIAQHKAMIKQLSKKVAQLLRQEHRRIVIVLEGMDAAGKGGAIKRIVKRLDPREYDIHSISAPEPYELRRPYLWRFWTKLAQGRKIQIFDRSWYGRVLVERIEQFAHQTEWQRAYDEINRFEQDLTQHQTLVVKFWLAISSQEQLHRFEQREQTPHKRFKITAEDWRNRAKWQDYLQASSDMLHYTHNTYAPWHIIATDSKYQARLQILQTLVKALS